MTLRPRRTEGLEIRDPMVWNLVTMKVWSFVDPKVSKLVDPKVSKLGVLNGETLNGET